MTSPLDHPHPGPLLGSYLARVVAVDDPDNLARIQVRLLTAPGDASDQDVALWARVAVPFAGNGCGAFLLPDVDDEVLVVFAGGDRRQPMVVGALWNGAASPPEQLGGDGKRVDRWTLVGKAKTRIAIVEERDGEATIVFETPGGVKGTLTDKSGGSFELTAAGTTVTLDTQGLTIDTPSKVKVTASQVEVTSAQIKVDAAISTFSGLVKCDVLQATTVIASTYTPGAGNVW